MQSVPNPRGSEGMKGGVKGGMKLLFGPVGDFRICCRLAFL